MSNPEREITPESVDKRADIITHEFFLQRGYMEERFDSIDERFDNIDSKLDSFMKETNDNFTTVLARLDDSDKRFEVVDDFQSKLLECVGKVLDDNSNIINLVEDVINRNKTLLKDISILEKSISALVKDISPLKSEQKKIRTDLSRLQRRVDDLEQPSV